MMTAEVLYFPRFRMRSVLLLPHPLRHLTPHWLPYRSWLTVCR